VWNVAIRSLIRTYRFRTASKTPPPLRTFVFREHSSETLPRANYGPIFCPNIHNLWHALLTFHCNRNQLHGHSASCKASSSSAREEMPHTLWKFKVHYRQINPVHALPPRFFTINFNITLIPMPKPPQSSLSFKFAHQNLTAPPSHPISLPLT
jgi:hypothetical protein